jgi:hypothetical protein
MNPKPASMFAFSPALLQDRREMWLATSRSGSPNDGGGVDLASGERLGAIH